MAGFPQGFLWGAATAGHQVEGGNVNADLWPMEWAEHSTFNEPSGDACDHYHRYPEDMSLLAELGLNAYRFSLEWSRIEPEPGYYSRAALDHYGRMMESCLNLGVTPVVTYNHFTVPRWMAGRGGWGRGGCPGTLRRLCVPGDRPPRRPAVVGLHAERTEPDGDDAQHGRPGHGCGRSRAGAGTRRGAARRRGIRPGALPDGDRGGGRRTDGQRPSAGGKAIKATAGTVKAGWTLALVDLQPAEGGETRWLEARRLGQTDWLSVSADDDFVGVQTYSRARIGPEGQLPVPDGTPTMQTGWEVYPDALGHTVRLAAEHAGVPILVTENGMATDDDEARIAYTSAALEGLVSCIDDGIDLRGYIHWTLLDNFEWNAGYSKTFGLIAVDRGTFVRSVKPSARWLGQVAQRNRID